MAATYKRVSRLIPSSQRAGVITNVEAGDEINIAEILGRPARRVKIVPSADTDVIELRLNNRLAIPSQYQLAGVSQTGDRSPATVYKVSKGEHYPVYSLTGSEEYYIEETIVVSFIQIEDITGGNATIYCW